MFLFTFEREREKKSTWVGEGREREMGTEDPKPAPKSDVQLTETARCPTIAFLYTKNKLYKKGD